MIENLRKHRRLLIGIVLAVAAVGFAVGLYFFNRIEKTELVGTDGRTFEKAVVTEIVKDNLAEDGNRYGDQTVRLKMRTGALKGQTVEATSPGGYLFGATCEPGMRVIAIASVADSGSVVTVYSADRAWVVLGFAALFLLVLCVIGGKSGVKSALSLIFICVCIFYLLFPMIYRGFSPIFAAVLIAVIATLVTMLMVGGVTAKAFSAVIGTVAGVIIAGLSALAFGALAGISGYNVSNIESLIFVANNTPMKIGELLFAGILISALGAVMDVSMSVASTIHEIYERNPAITKRQLFASGINVGKDMMGTMSITLILAFVGSSVSTLMVNYAYDLPARQMINSYSIGIEVMQGIAGSLGIILTVPLVSIVSAYLIPGRHHAA